LYASDLNLAKEKDPNISKKKMKLLHFVKPIYVVPEPIEMVKVRTTDQKLFFLNLMRIKI